MKLAGIVRRVLLPLCTVSHNLRRSGNQIARGFLAAVHSRQHQERHASAAVTCGCRRAPNRTWIIFRAAVAFYRARPCAMRSARCPIVH